MEAVITFLTGVLSLKLFLCLAMVIYLLRIIQNTIEYFVSYKDLKMLNRNGRIVMFIITITISPLIQIFFYLREKYNGE